MSKATAGEKSQQGRLADMSLPPEQRGRRGRGKRQRKKRREGEAKMRRSR